MTSKPDCTFSESFQQTIKYLYLNNYPCLKESVKVKLLKYRNICYRQFYLKFTYFSRLINMKEEIIVRFAFSNRKYFLKFIIC